MLKWKSMALADSRCSLKIMSALVTGGTRGMIGLFSISFFCFFICLLSVMLLWRRWPNYE